METAIPNLINQLNAASHSIGRRGILLGDPVSEEIIRQFEDKLGVKFPDDYREFLQSYGYLGIADTFFFGIWMDDLEATGDGSILGETTKLRREYNLPHYLIPFYGRETYAYACMNCSPVPANQRIVDFSPPIGEIQAFNEANSFKDYLVLYLQRRLKSLAK
ncbi:MAG TPA: SMI1/KNR4 family protein [Oligoflexus sp.]|uniref:SMI1/KNR4 family protein n=1 Tax=Oligoflexus sp. TaxID=1971216 RepID=UPI002D6B3F41|nr:SMI1/KNR4 family protein [Oligoflexus sp.]HYX39695.1 SMI1/KNR4 family protein [Oligoflexus sp.]